MKPDLELVQVRDDQSFKIWSHGYPYRTVRWHFHPEFELHLVTNTQGDRYVGDHIGWFVPGDLVLVGPNLPHNWISHVPEGVRVEERCVVLQFTADFVAACLSTFPELRFLKPLLQDAYRGLRFGPEMADPVERLMRAMLDAADASRPALFLELLERIGRAENQLLLASAGFQPNPQAYRSTTMNLVLQHIGSNFARGVHEAELASLSRQSISGFSRSFRKHTGMTFVQYVNALRIELACQHLSQADLTVTEICYEVGFNNVSNFNRQFLSAKGMPPTRFRHLHRKGAGLSAAA